MDDEPLLAELLEAISKRGAMTLEAVMLALEHTARIAVIARAFQTARASRLIEECATDHDEPCYALTDAGMAVLARAMENASDAASTADVLRVLVDFQGFGGTSIQLAAWELGLPDTALADGWAEAAERGLIESVAQDEASGEVLWQLTARGRLASGLADDLEAAAS